MAQDQKEKALGVIFSGAGEDGLEGSRVIKENGGLVIAQDPATAISSSMPQSIVSSNIADYVIQINKMPKIIIKYADNIGMSNIKTKKKFTQVSTLF